MTILSEAEQYRKALIRVEEAARGKNHEAYRKERNTLISQASAELYAAATTVYVLGDLNVSSRANAILVALYAPNEPTSLESFNLDASAKALKDGTRAMTEFQRVARADLLK